MVIGGISFDIIDRPSLNFLMVMVTLVIAVVLVVMVMVILMVVVVLVVMVMVMLVVELVVVVLRFLIGIQFGKSFSSGKSWLGRE